jgi:hypothetical protein
MERVGEQVGAAWKLVRRTPSWARASRLGVSQVAVAEVVGHDDQEVGFFRGLTAQTDKAGDAERQAQVPQVHGGVLLFLVVDLFTAMTGRVALRIPRESGVVSAR